MHRQPAADAIDEVLRLHHGWNRDRRAARVAELSSLVGWTNGRSGRCPGRCPAASGSEWRSTGLETHPAPVRK
jgi:hypothetical protein